MTVSGRVKLAWPTATSPGGARVGRQGAHRRQPAGHVGDVGQVGAVGRVVVERRDAGARAEHQQVVAGGGEGGEDVVALAARGRCTADSGRRRGDRSHRPPERGDPRAAAPRAAPWARPAWSRRRGGPRSPSTRSQVVASMPSTTVLQVPRSRSRRWMSVRLQPRSRCTSEPAAVVGEGDVGPRLLVRQVGEARRVVLGRVAEPVPPHGAVVARVVVADRRRDPGSACTRSRCRRAARPPTRRGCGGGHPAAACRWPPRGCAASSARRPRSTCRTRPGPRPTTARTSRSRRWPCRSRRPDRSGSGPGPSTASASGRTTSAARSRPAHRSIVKRRSPRTEGAVAVPASVSSARRARSRPRAGMASRAVRVRSFWAVVQARTSSEEPSSNQRYGSATSMPCRVSTMSSTRVGGGGGTSFRASATSCGRGWASGRGWPSSCGPGGWPSWCAST